MVSSFYGLVSPKSWMGGGSQISNNSSAITDLDIRARRSENISLYSSLHLTLAKWPMKLITLICREKSMSERRLNASPFRLITALFFSFCLRSRIRASVSHERLETRIKRTRRLWISKTKLRLNLPTMQHVNLEPLSHEVRARRVRARWIFPTYSAVILASFIDHHVFHSEVREARRQV